MTSPDPTPGYTPSQIQTYYTRINLPLPDRHDPGPSSQKISSHSTSGLPFLSTLQRYSLSSIPFENLDLHYSSHHQISINPTHLFSKQVTRKNGNGGRGGYCMENNTVFANVLRGLGFCVMSTGARISSSVGSSPVPLEKVTFSGWSHMVNLVSFQDKPDLWYFVDVGFGSGCAVFPIPLLHDEEGRENVGDRQWVRLRCMTLPGNTSMKQKSWVFEKKEGVDGVFSPCYAFAGDMMEFLQADFEVMNHFTSTARTSFFTWAPLAAKMVLSEDGSRVVGEKTMYKGGFRKRINGEVVESREMVTEEERIRVLDEEFGIPLDEDERAGILGTVSALS